MTAFFGENFWDERYSGSSAVWSGNPNPQLVAEAAGLAPGRALDIGCGEGADSLWLAGRGWQVTAVDFSQVALRKASGHVARRAEAGIALSGAIAWEHHDLLQWAPPGSSFDLVTAQFMHLPSAERTPLFARLAAAVVVGGRLLIVGHSATDIAAGARRPNDPDLFFTASELGARLTGTPARGHWEINVSDARPRAASNPEGHPITVHDEVLLARRVA